LDRPVDVLLEDELCHPSLWYHNRKLTEPTAIISLVHLLRAPDPDRFFSGVYRDIERWYLDTVDGAICTSEFTQRETTTLSEMSSTVAYPGGRRDGRVDEQRKPDHSDGPLDILFVGNIIRRKGTRTLVDALGRLDGEWTATIIGDPTVDSPYAQSVRDRIETHGLSDRISMPGRVDGESLDTALARADVLAVPSSYEGFGMVYLEAMEHGTVPIASAVGGTGELITHNENGFLVGPDDPTAIHEILRGLCEDRPRLAQLSAAACATANDHPTWTESLAKAREFMLDRCASLAECRR
jgi:glycosyltransferase involved in cell wall biosynthesis